MRGNHLDLMTEAPQTTRPDRRDDADTGRLGVVVVTPKPDVHVFPRPASIALGILSQLEQPRAGCPLARREC
jgi:hypothetical protein